LELIVLTSLIIIVNENSFSGRFFYWWFVQKDIKQTISLTQPAFVSEILVISYTLNAVLAVVT
jgi:hypothetical protein